MDLVSIPQQRHAAFWLQYRALPDETTEEFLARCDQVFGKNCGIYGSNLETEDGRRFDALVMSRQRTAIRKVATSKQWSAFGEESRLVGLKYPEPREGTLAFIKRWAKIVTAARFRFGNLQDISNVYLQCMEGRAGRNRQPTGGGIRRSHREVPVPRERKKSAWKKNEIVFSIERQQPEAEPEEATTPQCSGTAQDHRESGNRLQEGAEAPLLSPTDVSLPDFDSFLESWGLLNAQFDIETGPYLPFITPPQTEWVDFEVHFPLDEQTSTCCDSLESTTTVNLPVNFDLEFDWALNMAGA